MSSHLRRCLRVLFLTILISGRSSAAATAEAPGTAAWMFLAATETSKGPASFPAILFKIDPSTHRLALIREVVPASSGVYFVRSGDGVLSIGSPHITPDRLTIVQRVGQSVRAVDVALPQNSIPTENVLVRAGEAQLELLRMIRVSSSTLAARELAISLTPARGLPQIERSRTIERFSHFEIGGAVAGFFGEWDGFQTDLLPTGVSGLSWSGIPKVIAPPPSELRYPKPMLTSVACADKHFLVIVVDRDHKVVETASQLTAFVFDRALNKWQSLSFDGSFTRLRLFDKWLTAMTITAQGVIARKGQVSNLPGISELKRSSKTNKEYEAMPGTDIPGKLVLINLETGQRIALTTGEANSEILSVTGNTVLYRINDQLLTS